NTFRSNRIIGRITQQAHAVVRRKRVIADSWGSARETAIVKQWILRHKLIDRGAHSIVEGIVEHDVGAFAKMRKDCLNVPVHLRIDMQPVDKNEIEWTSCQLSSLLETLRRWLEDKM